MSDLATIANLKPAPYNPRQIDDEAMAGLRHSVGEFGDISGLVWNKQTGHLVCGHQRLQALRDQWNGKLKLEEGVVLTPKGDRFPVRVVDWPEPKEKAANITANNPHISGEFTSALGPLLEELKVELPDLSKALRLDAIEVPEPVGMQDGLTDPDDVPEPPEKPISEKGDLWLLGDHRLLCGDCTVAADVERVMAGERPELMVTDPPYGVNYDPNWRNEADRANGKPYGARAVGLVTNDNNADWSSAYELFPGDVAYVWHPAGATQGIFLASLQSAGFNVRITIVWAKSHFPIGRGHYHVQHEPCFYAVRKGATGHWAGDRKQTTLWAIPKPSKSATGHSTQKPIECMARPIRNHQGNVYDPFCGSGTTIIAAEQLGRKCYAIEIEPRYVDVAVRRWEKFTGQKAHTEAGKVMPDE